MINTKETSSRVWEVVTIIGLFSLVLGSLLIPLSQVNANDDIEEYVLECSPRNQTVYTNTPVSFSVTALVGTQDRFYIWSAPNSINPSQSGQGFNNFTTSYNNPGSYRIVVFPRNLGNDPSYCFVNVLPAPTPTPTPTPIPTPTPTPTFISADIKCNGIDGPCTIPFNSVVNITWVSRGATGCTVLPTGWSGTSGVRPDTLTNQATYIVNCNNGTNSATDLVTVFVVQPTPTPTPTPFPTPSPTPTPLPITASIYSNPSSICVGQPAYLSWTTNNATQAVINQLGAVNLYSGSQSVSPSQTMTYTLTATNNQGGYAVASTTIFVTGYCYTPTPTPTPTNLYLSISKTVRNISSNTNELESVNANNNDTVEFIIRVSTSSNQTATNVRISDSLPYGLNYVSGSTTVDNSYWNDGITNGGIDLGSFYPNRFVTIRFRATVNQSYTNNSTTTLTNNATVTADNASTASDSASVVITSLVVQNQSLSVQKFGKNVSRGETANTTSINASSNETIEFDIIVTTLTSGTATNVIVTDLLPAGLTYVSNSTSLNGNIIANGITGSGINIGSLSSNQQALIKLFATVDTIPAGQSKTMINSSQVRSDNISTANSNQVNVNVNQGVVLGALNVKTGASSALYISLLAGLLSTAGFYWYKVRMV